MPLVLFFVIVVNRWMCLCVQAKAEEEEVDHTPWGELEPSDEESSEEEEEEESDEEKPDETGFITPADRYLTSVNHHHWAAAAELSLKSS